MNDTEEKPGTGIGKELAAAAREFGGFIAKFVSGSLDQGMGIFEDKLRYMRWERQVRLMQRANEFLKERGLSRPTRPVQLKVAIPLFQGASLEDDNELQDVWARLLVNAADKDSGITIQRAHITILENIGDLELRILDKAYAVPEESAPEGLYTKYLPERILVNKPEEENLRPSPEVEWAISNLIRLGCLVGHMSWGGTPLLSIVNQTVLGRSFAKAHAKPAT